MYSASINMYPVEESAHKQTQKPKPNPYMPRGYQKKKKSDQRLTVPEYKRRGSSGSVACLPGFAVNT